MLYWLLYLKLFHYFPPFRIFRYLTFRTAFASLTALFTGLIVGPLVIQRLRDFQIGQYIREEGPQAHQKKAGTPTMGGLLIAIAILVPTLLWADLSNPFVWIAVFSTVAFGGHRLHRRLPEGGSPPQSRPHRPRQDSATRSPSSVVIAVALIVLQHRGEYSTRLVVPFFKQFHPDLVIQRLAAHPHLWPLAFLPFVVFVVIVIVGSSNAVNLTDGLDGLAIGCTVIAAGALAVLTYLSGHATFATYLELQRMPQIGELTIFCGAMVGSAIGFLWYNAHPAEVFMGDVGSLALGGAIGTVAVMIKQELLLPFIGGIFVIEALSVILQVGSYKLRKKANFQDGAHPPPFRTAGLVGVKGDRALLDRVAGVRAVRADDAEIAMRF